MYMLMDRVLKKGPVCNIRVSVKKNSIETILNVF